MPKPDLTQLDHLKTTDSLHNSNHNLNGSDINDELESIDDELENTVLRLSDYLAAVELVVKETFNHSVWVKAEIRNLSSKNGHYYFELAEKNDDGKVVASCRGNLWKFKATRVLRKFEHATGMQLDRDVTVLLNVTASMHPLYGFSLTINDIDPSYTLGDLARQYAAMLEMLSSEGLLDLNKQLLNPFDIEHVLVIAPEKAAGLGDFRADADKLDSTGACHFHYHYSTFQSNTAPAEIRHAITKGMLTFKNQYEHLPDLIVIIRGGGAVGDLAYLNDYELAALVAEQPVPVWVGIGHERDKVILDEVAHTSFDTPSKVITAIKDHLVQLMRRTQHYTDSIKQLSLQQLFIAKNTTDTNYTLIQNQSSKCVQQWQHAIDTKFNHIKHYARFQCQSAYAASTQSFKSIEQHSHNQIALVHNQTSNYYADIKRLSQNRIDNSYKQINHYRQLALVQNPTRILNQGYALIKNDAGTYLNSINDVEKGDFIQLRLQDGEMSAVVTNINPFNTQPEI